MENIIKMERKINQARKNTHYDFNSKKAKQEKSLVKEVFKC